MHNEVYNNILQVSNRKYLQVVQSDRRMYFQKNEAKLQKTFVIHMFLKMLLKMKVNIQS